MYLYSVGVQDLTILNILLKAERLVNPDCNAASVIDKSGEIRSFSAWFILFSDRNL